MAEETNSVRITNAQVYAEVMELKAIQIEAVTELRGMKNLPERISAIEQDIARLKVIAGLAYAVFGAVLTGVVAALLRVV
jgi:uncharacterized small protein (DUF1192 family)